MRFQIFHQTSYRYDRPVILGRHTFRMQPREGPFLRLSSFRIALFPRPVEETVVTDAEGNLVVSAIFEGSTHECRVQVSSEGEVFPRPPIRASSSHLSSLPSGESVDDVGGAGASVLLLPSPAAVSAPVAELTKAVLEETGFGAVEFLEGLSRVIHRDFRNAPRPLGPPLPPEQTVRDRGGSCRDLAVLFMASCRSLGLEARFVSGYTPAPPGEFQHMHAWCEVHIPGIGWTPFDPTHSEGVGEEHIPVAVAATPADAAPLTGTFAAQAGGFARSEMSVSLRVLTGRAREPGPNSGYI